jgi:hypothetical protein
MLDSLMRGEVRGRDWLAVAVRDNVADWRYTAREPTERRGFEWQGDPMPYRYRPRDFLRQPDFFGRRVDAEWKPYSEADRAKVAAAYYQHLAACEVLRVAGEKDWNFIRAGSATRGQGRHP